FGLRYRSQRAHKPVQAEVSVGGARVEEGRLAASSLSREMTMNVAVRPRVAARFIGFNAEKLSRGNDSASAAAASHALGTITPCAHTLSWAPPWHACPSLARRRQLTLPNPWPRPQCSKPR